MVFLITSSLLGAVNFITTIIQLRARDDLDAPALFRLGPIRDGLSVAARLSAAGSRHVMQLMDRVAATSFFLPSGLMVTERHCRSAAVAVRFCGSICFGSSLTRKFTC